MNIQEKICLLCNKNLPLSSFEKTDTWVRNQCKLCRGELLRKRREERKIINQNTDILKKYKTCITCNKKKDVSEFNRLAVNKDGLCNYCRDCFKINRKKPNKIETTIKIQVNLKRCIKCFTDKSISEFRITSKSKDGHYHTCNSCWKPREWNKEKQKESEKKYVEKNPEKIKEKYKKQGKNINRRLRNSLNKRIISALQIFSVKKERNTFVYTGCDVSFLKKWFEFLFTSEMNWENYGLWHIDHVKPCSSFDLQKEEEIQKCFNWQNLRPCWGKENIEKGSQIISEVIEKQTEKVKQFLINSLPNYPGDRDGGTE